MTTMELDREKDNANQKAFEEQVRDEYADALSEADEKIILHDEENGDIEVNVPKSITTEKNAIDVGKVIALHNAKWSQAKIADEMGCSQSMVCRIIKKYKQ